METQAIGTREWIIQEILAIRRNGVFPSLTYVGNHHLALLEAAECEFIGWEWALVAAKVIKPPFDSDMFYDHNICAWAHDSLTIPVNR